MKINWKPIRKIGAAFGAFLVSGAGVTLIDALTSGLTPTVAAAIVGGITVLTGYLVPSAKAASEG